MLMLDYLQECSLSPHHNLYSAELTTYSSSIIPSWFHSHSGPAWILRLTWTIIPLKPPSTSSPFSPLWNLFSKTSTRLALHHLHVLEPKHLNVTGENETIFFLIYIYLFIWLHRVLFIYLFIFNIYFWLCWVFVSV